MCLSDSSTVTFLINHLSYTRMHFKTFVLSLLMKQKLAYHFTYSILISGLCIWHRYSVLSSYFLQFTCFCFHYYHVRWKRTVVYGGSYNVQLQVQTKHQASLYKNEKHLYCCVWRKHSRLVLLWECVSYHQMPGDVTHAIGSI